MDGWIGFLHPSFPEERRNPSSSWWLALLRARTCPRGQKNKYDKQAGNLSGAKKKGFPP